MSITFRNALTAIALCAIPSIAAAKPRRLVILDFDGPEADADGARAAIVAMLGGDYDVVSTERWTQARNADDDSPAMWLAAARATGVDTVITGWIQPDETGPSSVTVQVLDATSGLEIDAVTVAMTADNDLSAEVTEGLHADLEDAFSAVDTGVMTIEDPPALVVAPDSEDDLSSTFSFEMKDDLGQITIIDTKTDPSSIFSFEMKDDPSSTFSFEMKDDPSSTFSFEMRDDLSSIPTDTEDDPSSSFPTDTKDDPSSSLPTDTKDDLGSIFPSPLPATPKFDTTEQIFFCPRGFTLVAEDPTPEAITPAVYPWPVSQPESVEFEFVAPEPDGASDE